ncbi:MAG: GNAT family N-acetyltransferase [Pirellulales bacterium]
MQPVLLKKRLNPDFFPKQHNLVSLQSFIEKPDSVAWRALHHQVFSPQTESGWSKNRFDAEFTNKGWWNPNTLWFSTDATTSQVTGSITLELPKKNLEIGKIHWLMVGPAFRRQGIAVALLAKLEQYAIDHGVKQLQAETLSNWEDAMAFYQRQGFTK